MHPTQVLIALVPLWSTRGGVRSWTIDLPEVRRYYFERYATQGAPERGEGAAGAGGLVDNIDTYSPHSEPPRGHGDHYKQMITNHKNDVDHEKYASDYEYQSYMEKKVQAVVDAGSAYLEGLRRALLAYEQQLENCTRRDNSSTPININWSAEFSNMTSSNTTSSNMTSPSSECERVTGASEHVRRLAALATWTTRRLEDHVYRANYQHTAEAEEEHEELVLQLAWFLDRLAHYTGFEPDAERHTTARPATRTPPTSSMPPLPAQLSGMSPPPDDVKASMLRCLQDTSAAEGEGAVERCRYPRPLPDELRQWFNVTDPPPAAGDVTGSRARRAAPAPANPLLEVMQYYVKHKAWTGANAALPGPQPADTHVDNHLVLRALRKRSVDHARVNKKSLQHRAPEDPGQDPSGAGRRDVQTDRVKMYLEKIRHVKGATVKGNIKKLEKEFKRGRRAVRYSEMLLPQIPEDPQRDISYYVKHKRGTRRRWDPAQAALVRAGLQQVYQTGDVEVARRYGANYNPLVPSVLLFGAAKSFSDI